MKNIKIVSLVLLISFFSCKTEKKEIKVLEKDTAPAEQIVTKTEVDSVPTVSEEQKVEKEEASQKKEIEKAVKNQSNKEAVKTITATVNDKAVVEEVDKTAATLKTATKQVQNNKTPAQEVKQEVVKQSLTPQILHINPSDFKNRITSKKVQLVDVRTPREYNTERINGAININYYEEELFRKKMATLDKSQPVYVYCRSGIRSGKSAIILKNAGFKVYDLKGGIKAWKSNDLETVK